MDGYYISLDNSTPGVVAPIDAASVGGAILPGFSYYITVPYPAKYIQLDLDLELNEGAPETEIETIGCFCKKCKDFKEYASPNQADKTFICYACLHNL